MSNDLISRRAVIDLIKPRLNSYKYGTLEYQRLYSILWSVENLPTAYDVGQAVEQLEKLKAKEYDNTDEEPMLTDFDGIYNEGVSQGKYIAFGKAIEIVKAGVVNG